MKPSLGLFDEALSRAVISTGAFAPFANAQWRDPCIGLAFALAVAFALAFALALAFLSVIPEGNLLLLLLLLLLLFLPF